MTLWLLRRTLRSVLAQTSQAWRLVLVGDEDPQIPELNDDRMIFQTARWPNPSRPMGDRFGKVVVGAEVAFELGVSTDDLAIMQLDADDMISSRLVAQVEEDGREVAGHLIEKGYLHVPGSKFCWKTERFDRLCGSSNIIFARRSNRTYFGSAEAFTYTLKAGHNRVREFMESIDYALAPIPFRAGIYSVSNGQNHSDDWHMKKWLTVLKNVPWRMQRVNAVVLAEFPGLADAPAASLAAPIDAVEVA